MKEASMSLANDDKKTARKKGLLAAAATGGAAALIITSAAPILGVIALVPAGYLVKDWFMYRAKRGMRF
jgi:uncharacterized membrane protein